MKQLTLAVGVLGLSLYMWVACTNTPAPSNTVTAAAPAPIDLGIFEQQNSHVAPFQYDTLTQAFHLARSNDDALRFVSRRSEQDFIMDVQLPKQSLVGSTFGILLATDAAGEYPIAALQVVDGKLVFAPSTRANSSNVLEVQADYIRMEYINGQAAAYYTIGEDKIRPIAIQQMDDEAAIYIGIFARNTAQDLSFEDIEFSHPEIEPPLSEK